MEAKPGSNCHSSIVVERNRNRVREAGSSVHVLIAAVEAEIW